MMPGESLDAAAMMEADMSVIKSSPRSAAEMDDNLQPLSSKNQAPPQYRVGSYIPAMKTSQAKKIMQADPQKSNWIMKSWHDAKRNPFLPFRS